MMMEWNDGGSCVLRACIDNNASTLLIAAGDGETNESHRIFNFRYETKTITSKTSTSVKSGDSVTTNVKTFSVQLISKLYNSDEELILRADIGSGGEINSYWDKDQKEIYTDEFDISPAEDVGIPGEEAPAIAWAIAKNTALVSSLKSQKKAYREGLCDSGADVSEDYDEPGSLPIEVGFNPENASDKVVSPGITDMSKGVYYTFKAGDTEQQETYYVKIYTEAETGIFYSPEGRFTYRYTNKLYAEVYNSFGDMVNKKDMGEWYVKVYDRGTHSGYYRISNVDVNGNECVVTTTSTPTGSGKDSSSSEKFYLGIPNGAAVVSTSSAKPFE